MPTYISKDEILSLVKELHTDKQHTYELQVSLQNIDFKKNQRFAVDCNLPHEKRMLERILIIADKPVEEECIRLSIPHYDKLTYQTDKPSIVYVTYEDVSTLQREKKRLKKKLCSNHHSIIATPTHMKAFEMRFVTAKRVPIYIIKVASELEQMIENVKKSTKLAVRKTPNVYTPVGHTGMDAEAVVDNINVTLDKLADALKKTDGPGKKAKEYVKNVMLKTTRSESKSLIAKKAIF